MSDEVGEAVQAEIALTSSLLPSLMQQMSRSRVVQLILAVACATASTVGGQEIDCFLILCICEVHLVVCRDCLSSMPFVALPRIGDICSADAWNLPHT